MILFVHYLFHYLIETVWNFSLLTLLLNIIDKLHKKPGPQKVARTICGEYLEMKVPQLKATDAEAVTI